MKKVPFIILVVFECLLDLIAVGMLLSFLGVFSYLIAMGVIALVLIPAFKKLKNSQDETEKRKIRRNAFLFLLIPIVLAIIVIAVVVFLVFRYFS